MPENVKLTDANFSEGPVTGNFYSCSFSRQELVQVQADGTEVDSFFVGRSSFRAPILQLHYDGTFFWTLEKLPSNLGMVMKKWRLFPVPTAIFPSVTPIEFRWQDELTLITQRNKVTWNANAFAVEHYHRTFLGSAPQGASSFRLNSVANISAGDTLYLGPTGASDTEEQLTVGSVNTSINEIAFTKPGGLESAYDFADPVDFTKGLFLFNDHFIGGNGSADDRGNLARFSYPSKNQTLSDTGGLYNGVSAADFDDDSLSWVKSFQIMEIDFSNPTFIIKSSQEANLVEDDRGTVIPVFDLISDLSGDKHSKLQLRETVEGFSDVLTTSTFANGKYNFQNHAIPAFVNSLALQFDTRFTEDFASGNTVDIIASVRDQTNFPLFNKTITFTSAINADSEAGTPGTFSPNTGVTNISGTVQTVYTPSTTATNIIVDVIAEVDEGGSITERITAVVNQVGSITTAAPSNPIEQFDNTPSFSSSPMEQREALATAMDGDNELSKPIEQRFEISFSAVDINDDNKFIEQIVVARDVINGPDTPIELKTFTTSDQPMEQKVIVRNAATAAPLEQTSSGTSTSIRIEQFNFSDFIFPPCGSTKNPVTTNILWRIKDFGFPFDVESLIFNVNGFPVQDFSNFTITAIPNGLQLDYNPVDPFEFDSLVTLQLIVSDNDVPPNTFIYNCTWSTVPDSQPPIIELISPVCDATNVSTTAPVVFSVLDIGNGVDLDTITLSIEGLPVCSGISFDGITTLSSGTGFIGTWTHANDPFRFGSTVSVAIEASDLSPLVNSTFFVCCFSTAESSGPVYQSFAPEQCATFVDNTTGLTFEVYGDVDGVDITTLEVRIDNKLRKVFVRPRIIRSV